MKPRMIPIILTVYFFTNIIWYVIAFVPIPYIPLWLSHIAKVYLVFLYMPFTAEKVVIIAVSMFIYRLIYKERFKKEV